MNAFHRWPQRMFFLFVAFALVVGCTSAAPQAAPTNPPVPTLVPTDTVLPPTDPPAPTDTPVPTDTPEPTATATPDLTATAAAQTTQAAAEAITKIDTELQKYDLSTKEGYLGWTSSGPTSLKVDSYNAYDILFISQDLKAKDFVMQADVTWDSTGGLAGCGFVFRAEADAKKGSHYRFLTIRLSGFPGWDIEHWDFGNWQRTITGNQVQTSRAINQEQGATNTYVLIAKGNQFTTYANGDRLRLSNDSKLTEGLLGLIVFQESGKTTCKFENGWVWVLK